MDLGQETIRLRGVIDRVDHKETGEIRVIDYKSGSRHLDPKDLESGVRLQLPIYALAAQDALQLGNVIEGLYWMIQSAKSGALKLSRFETDNGQGVDEAVRVVIEHLKAILTGIRAAEFPPKPSKGECSPYCPAVQWCWHYQPGWGGGK
jgi:RecB family exonuclease